MLVGGSATRSPLAFPTATCSPGSSGGRLYRSRSHSRSWVRAHRARVRHVPPGRAAGPPPRRSGAAPPRAAVARSRRSVPPGSPSSSPRAAGPKLPVELQQLNTVAFDYKQAYRESRCFLQPWQGARAFRVDCVDGGTGKLLLLWGDSHAAHLYPGLVPAARERRFRIAQLTASACPPLLDYRSSKRPKCHGINQAALAKARALRPETVVFLPRSGDSTGASTGCASTVAGAAATRRCGDRRRRPLAELAARARPGALPRGEAGGPRPLPDAGEARAVGRARTRRQEAAAARTRARRDVHRAAGRPLQPRRLPRAHRGPGRPARVLGSEPLHGGRLDLVRQGGRARPAPRDLEAGSGRACRTRSRASAKRIAS